jgi:hypothetical protein
MVVPETLPAVETKWQGKTLNYEIKEELAFPKLVRGLFHPRSKSLP